jgi:hypothetical protein
MNSTIKIVLAAGILMPAFSSALAEPLPASVNPRTVPRISDETRRAVVPPPATGPCRAELSVDRIEISRRADRSAYDITVTVKNSGTEPATGTSGGSRSVLGLKLEVNSLYTPRSQLTYTAQVADIDVVNAGASRSYGFSVSATNIPRGSRDIIVRIDRGPDGPRCAYDSRVNNDALSVSEATMRGSLNAGNRTYVRVAPWAM